MPTNNKKPSNPDLSTLLEGLVAADIEFILVGGLAAVIQVNLGKVKYKNRFPSA